MKLQMVKNLLMSQIKIVAANAKSFCIDAERNFSRCKINKKKVTKITESALPGHFSNFF